ncbi:MAG: hypothetical protein WA405_10085 [Candidatus Acidiferrales bacterium]
MQLIPISAPLAKKIIAETGQADAVARAEKQAAGDARRGWIVFAVIVLGLMILSGILSKRDSNQMQSTAAAPSSAVEESAASPTPGDAAAERNFLGAAASYLITANQEEMKAAQTMAGATDGTSTLNDIRSALSSAKFIENAGYEGDYLERIGGRPPKRFAGLAASVDETHRLFQDATGEYLEYWNDQNVEDIESGNATMLKCVNVTNSTISEANKEMSTLKSPTAK